LIVDELLGLGGGAVTLEPEKIISARYKFAVAAFASPLGGDEFGEFCSSDSGGF